MRTIGSLDHGKRRPVYPRYLITCNPFKNNNARTDKLERSRAIKTLFRTAKGGLICTGTDFHGLTVYKHNTEASRVGYLINGLFGSLNIAVTIPFS